MIMVLWLGLLFSTIGIAASDFFCINLNTIATILGMSESMAGVTFLALGNGSPDVFSTFAAMSTHSGSLAVGELIGAAGFITAVVAGSMALVRPFRVARKSFVRDVGFFIVAASFSMVFLADGHLYLWECATMVAFYFFYVVTVVIWHWYLGRQTYRKAKEALARGQFNIVGNDAPNADEGSNEEVGDDRRGKGVSQLDTLEDFAALERGNSSAPIYVDDEADDETRGRWMAEMSSNMRLSRLPARVRRPTATPIRPSLVGALEFRAVLSSLHKSRNIQTTPINLRRYSDDPSLTLSQHQRNSAARPELRIEQHHIDPHEFSNSPFRVPRTEDDQGSTSTRARAVSANDATGLHLHTDYQRDSSVPQIDLLGPTPPGSSSLQIFPGERVPSLYQSRSTSLLIPSSHNEVKPQIPTLSPPLLLSSTHLAPPQDGNRSFEDHTQQIQQSDRDNANPIEGYGKRRTLSRMSSTVFPGTAGSSPAIPFPLYHDDPDFVPNPSRPPSLRLPPSSLGSDSLYHQSNRGHLSQKLLLWWPYKILPSPAVLVSTLFPTLYSWQNKNGWEKALGIVAAPSVFLLAITLPVVEVEKVDDALTSDDALPIPNVVSSPSSAIVAVPAPATPSVDDTNPDSLIMDQNAVFINQNGEPDSDSHISTTTVPLNGDLGIQAMGQRLYSDLESVDQRSREANASMDRPPSSPKEWNRWLVSTQIFTAPSFIVFIIWANTDPMHSFHNLLIPSLYTLIGSLVVFAFLLLTTSDTKPPRYRVLLCFLGFIVSIAWISTIANEVVGVLKALGVILGISDAILGLTIFAVGNSLGDLVADITVAKLGYPVMALSACFGGPMLNILLGIGLSGLYLTIRDSNGRHDRHPNRPIKYKPYQIEVGRTLIISGITLLVTLVGLLIMVPLNKWQMDRKIGWGLVTLWSISTIGNLVVEMSAWG